MYKILNEEVCIYLQIQSNNFRPECTLNSGYMNHVLYVYTQYAVLCAIYSYVRTYIYKKKKKLLLYTWRYGFIFSEMYVRTAYMYTVYFCEYFKRQRTKQAISTECEHHEN